MTTHAVAEFAVTEHAPGLTCAPASFAITGNVIGDVLQCAPESYVLIGQNAQQAWTVESGSFSFAGQAALTYSVQHAAADYLLFGRNLSYSYEIGSGPAEGAVAEYAVAEFPSIQSGDIITAESAIFSLSGQATAYDLLCGADAAVFALGGLSAEFALPADAAAFALAGSNAGYSWAHAVATASFTLEGNNAPLVVAMPADVGHLAVAGGESIAVGSTALLGASYSLFPRATLYRYTIPHSPTEGAVAEYALTEFPALDLYGLLGRTTAFALTAPPITLPTAIDADGNSYTLTGNAAEFAVPFDATSFAFDGKAITTSLVAPVGAAQYILTGCAAEQAWPVNVATYLVSCQDATTLITMAAAGGQFTFTSPDALLLPGKAFYPDAASFSLAGQDLTLVAALLAQAAPFALSGRNVDLARYYQASAGSFALSGQSAWWAIKLGALTGQYTILGWSIADAIGPSGDSIYLIEVQAHNGSSLVTFYLSTEGFTSQSVDTPPNQTYIPRVIDPGNLERVLFSGTETRGRSSVGAGDIVVASGDPGNGDLVDDWLNYGWSGRSVVVKALPSGAKSVSAAATIFRGRLDKIIATNPLERFELRIADRLADLDKPLLTTQFAGTTTSSGATAEGNDDIKGQIKQQIWGECYNIPVQPANVYDLIYLVSNSSLQSIDAIYDGGLALTIDGDSANIGALQAASISSGHARTCNAAGLIRLGATPTYAVTVDAKEGANAAARTAAQIAKRMLIVMGETAATYVDGSFSNVDGKNSAVCGIIVRDDSKGIDVIQEVLDSIGAWMVPNNDGAFTVGRLEAPTVSPALTLDIESQSIGSSLARSDSPIPVWRVNVQYGRIGLVQDDAALAGAVTSTRRAYLRTEYRSVSSENVSIKTKHLNAVEVTVSTTLVSQSAAQTEAARLLALHGAEREKYDLTFALSDAWAATPGNSVTLVHSRLGFDVGKPFVVLGRVDQFADAQVKLSVWG